MDVEVGVLVCVCVGLGFLVAEAVGEGIDVFVLTIGGGVIEGVNEGLNRSGVSGFPGLVQAEAMSTRRRGNF
jgi:hypothetical protein